MFALPEMPAKAEAATRAKITAIEIIFFIISSIAERLPKDKAKDTEHDTKEKFSR